MSSRLPRIKCPVCGKKVGVYIPRGGDGSAYRLYAHKIFGVSCHGSYLLDTNIPKELR